MKTLIGSALILGMVGTASAAVNCNTFPNSTVTGNVNDDVEASGYTCTIASSGFINGALLQTGEGSLVIRGVINGEVSEAGNGDVTINGGQGRRQRQSKPTAAIWCFRDGGSANGGLEESGVQESVNGDGGHSRRGQRRHYRERRGFRVRHGKFRQL